jgi:hypothetical protein
MKNKLPNIVNTIFTVNEHANQRNLGPVDIRTLNRRIFNTLPS